MTRRVTAPLSAAALCTLLLVGCSANGETSAPTPSTSMSDATTTSTPTAAVRMATVAQWAGFVAQQQAILAETWQAWEADTCSALSIDYVPCGLSLTALGYESQTIALNVDMATNPEHEDYLGAPPAEIQQLVESLAEAAQKASDLSKPAAEACPDSDACTGAAFQFEGALEDLQLEFVAWTPYL